MFATLALTAAKSWYGLMVVTYGRSMGEKMENWLARLVALQLFKFSTFQWVKKLKRYSSFAAFQVFNISMVAGWLFSR